MKYKSIKSMSHNWTHSFMSGMNHVDGDFVFKDMHRVARENRGQTVTIHWIPERDAEPLALTPRIRKSVWHYRNALVAHIARHNIDPFAIVELRTEVYVAANHRLYVRAYALDDRGKEHAQFVWS